MVLKSQLQRIDIQRIDRGIRYEIVAANILYVVVVLLPKNRKSEIKYPRSTQIENTACCRWKRVSIKVKNLHSSPAG